MCRADNLTTFMCRMSLNLGASNSWNPQGLSRPVMGLLFFLNKETTVQNCTIIEYKPHYGKLYVAQDGDKWRAALNAEMKLRVP